MKHHTTESFLERAAFIGIVGSFVAFIIKHIHAKETSLAIECNTYCFSVGAPAAEVTLVPASEATLIIHAIFTITRSIVTV